MALFIYPAVQVSTAGLALESKQDTMIANQATSLANEATMLASDVTMLSNMATSLANEALMVADLQSLVDLTQLTVVDVQDTPIIDTSSTNIPGSASSPLEVVASLAADVQQIQSVEDIGEYIGVYTGAASSEVLKAVLPLGGGEVKLEIPAGTRVSLRSMSTSAISLGKIALNFLG